MATREKLTEIKSGDFSHNGKNAHPNLNLAERRAGGNASSLALANGFLQFKHFGGALTVTLLKPLQVVGGEKLHHALGLRCRFSALNFASNSGGSMN